MTRSRGIIWDDPRKRRGIAAFAASALALTLSAGAVPGVTLASAPIPDREVRLLDAGQGPSVASSLDLVARVTGAAASHAAGYDGKGVDIALIDSGVAPVDGLLGSQIVIGPDFSTEGDDPDTAGIDGFGHGTHLAGIIVGNDPASSFVGIAPESRLVSVKVADAEGNTDTGARMAAIDWVVENRRKGGLDIKVLNLAFGADADNYLSDPLAAAVETAWQNGITVVAAAGNAGSSRAGLDSPAYDPYVISVGAADIKGTESRADDTVADFSSRGAGRNPDVLAPGVSVVSLRNPESLLDAAYPGAREGESLFRGSGSSQASAVVAGLAALMLDRKANLDPDQVKAALVGTAIPLAGFGPEAQGAGLVDITGVAKYKMGRVDQRWERSTALGKAGKNALKKAKVVYVDDATKATAAGSRWSGSRWSGSRWSGSRWSGSRWSGGRWSGGRWSGGRWSGAGWPAEG